jgi:drug/metabolite transporter (DMT)-like permease
VAEWLSLVAVAIIYVLCAYLSYSINWHDRAWYMPVGVFLGTSTVVLWYVMVKHLADKDRIYFYSLVWDVILVFVYYLLPIFCFGVKLDRNGVIGICLMLAGLVLMKLK